MIDINELRMVLARHGTSVLNEDEILELLDRLEAAEKELESWKGLAQQFGNEADELRAAVRHEADCVEACKAEVDRLRAKIEAMEKQKPFDADSDAFRSAIEARVTGAQPAPSAPVGLITDYLMSISAHVAHQDDRKAQAEIGELLRMLAAAQEAKP